MRVIITKIFKIEMTLAILVLNSCNVRQEKNAITDLDDFALKGRVKFVNQRVYNATDINGIPSKTTDTIVEFFNDFSMPVNHNHTILAGGSFDLEINEGGFMIKKIDWKNGLIFGDLIEKNRHEKYYDKSNRLIKELSILDNKDTSERIFIYKEKIITKKEKTSSGHTFYSDTYKTFDNKDSFIIQYINKPADVYFRTNYVYDSYRRVTSQTEYSEGAFYYRYTWDYSDLKEEFKSYNRNGLTQTKITYFDSSNKKIIKIIDKNNSYGEPQTTYYKYNQKGDIVEENAGNNGSSYRKIFLYEYDKYNNWIRRITQFEAFGNVVTKYITKRDITYFNDK